MSDSRIRQGHVTKVVRLPSAAATMNGDLEGYGIVRSDDGRDVYFVDAVVVDGGFADLEIGDAVNFTLEPGPLARAIRVWPSTSSSPSLI